jgi:hypothetical protein
MLDILNVIPGKKRATTSGWYAFNGVCCSHRGHKPDKRNRAGVIIHSDEHWTYSCFNCGFKAGTAAGKQYSSNVKKLLDWCGIDKMQIERLSFQNFTNRSLDEVDDYRPIIVSFHTKDLPQHSELLDPNNPLHEKHIKYVESRGLSVDSYPFYVSPLASPREQESILIPYFYNKRIVGYTRRFYDNQHPKYLSEQQRGYIFNMDAQQDDWQVCFLVEGQFDAIAIGGCAYLGSTINDEQSLVLKKLRRTIIVIPDRDKAGMSVCSRALDLGYKVSIPEWSSEVKDVNDAVKKYGRLATTLSILEAATSSKIIIEMKRRKYQ